MRPQSARKDDADSAAESPVSQRNEPDVSTPIDTYPGVNWGKLSDGGQLWSEYLTARKRIGHHSTGGQQLPRSRPERGAGGSLPIMTGRSVAGVRTVFVCPGLSGLSAWSCYRYRGRTERSRAGAVAADGPRAVPHRSVRSANTGRLTARAATAKLPENRRWKWLSLGVPTDAMKRTATVVRQEQAFKHGG